MSTFEKLPEPFFIVELKVNPSQIHELRSVIQGMVDSARTDEPGTLNYEWFLNEGRTACYIYERYADPAAVVTHGSTLPEKLHQRGRAFPPTRLTVYGKVMEEVLEKKIEPVRKAGVNVLFLERIGGLTR